MAEIARVLLTTVSKIILFACTFDGNVCAAHSGSRTGSFTPSYRFACGCLLVVAEYFADKLFDRVPFYEPVKTVVIVVYVCLAVGFHRLCYETVKPVYEQVYGIFGYATRITDVMFMNFGNIFWNFTNHA